MDDTQQSRTSDAAATRKRRSSILKSQRAPRAPLSELEFHVATPTDTAKSRRVSFSRRTGVAEFVTNEATTTWKNFYEEHNKSLESSGNESAANAPRPSAVGHLGKRIFEDQFQEVEMIDYGSAVNETRGVENSMNNVKFDQFAFECTTDDGKLTAPGPHFERSAFTVSEQPSKLFGDDLAISGLGEISDKINVDFSTLQPVGDDLDEIQKDLQRHQANQQNFVCPGPRNGRNMSGYIEVDLNATHVTVDCEANSLTEDMSITDTIHSPKVNVSKNTSTLQTDKSLNKDWVADKENIAVNPYVAPKESANFAINEIPDQVLVFDGKRLTLQSEREPVTDYRKTLISTEQPIKPPQRKTIVINVDDDLPNFVANPHASICQHSKNCSTNETLLGNSCNISMTQPLQALIETNTNKRQTIVFENNAGDISMTQALPTNIAPATDGKRRTIVFDNDTADISVTQAVPSNVIIAERKGSVNEAPVQKRQTMVFENEMGNISITQAVPTNMILGNNQVAGKRATMVFDDDDGNISVTKPIPSNILFSEEAKYTKTIPSDDGFPSIPSSRPNKRNTIVFENEDGNISVTKAIPSNILLSEESSKIVNNAPFENPDAILSIPLTKMETNKRNTIVFHDEDADISVTKAIPLNIIFTDESKSVKASSSAEPDVMLPVSSTVPNKRRTIMFTDEDGNISVTKAIPSEILLSEVPKSVDKTPFENPDVINPDYPSIKSETNKRKTIVFNDDDGNLSITKAIPTAALYKTLTQDTKPSQTSAETSKRKTIVFDDGNISVTQAIPSNILLSEQAKETGKRKTICFDDGDGNISVTQAIPSNILFSEQAKKETDKLPHSISSSSQLKTEHGQSMIFNEEDGNISFTKAIPLNLILPEQESAESFAMLKNGHNVSTKVEIQSSSLFEKEPNNQFHHLSLKPESTIAYDEDGMDISMTQALPTNIVSSHQRKTIVHDENARNISAMHTTAGNMSCLKISNSKTMSEILNMSPNDDFEEINKTTTKYREPSFSHTLLSKTMDELLHENNKSMVVEPVVNNPSIAQISPPDENFSTVPMIEETNSVEKNPANIFVSTAASEGDIIPEAMRVDDSYSEQKVEKTHDFIVNLGETLNASELKQLPTVSDNQNVSMSKQMNITILKDEPINSNMNRTHNQSNYDLGDKLSEIASDSGKNKSILILSPKSKDTNAELVTDSEKLSMFASTTGIENTDTDVKYKQDANHSISNATIPVHNCSTTVQDLNISNKNTQLSTESKYNCTITTTTDYDHVVQNESTDNVTKKHAANHSLKIEDNLVTEHAANHSLKMEDDLVTKHAANHSLKMENNLARDINTEDEQLMPPNDKDSNITKNIENSFYHEDKRKSYKNADCTKDLLDMLSKFTEPEEEENPVPEIKPRKAVSEGKTDLPVDRLLGQSRRQSVVLSREDLMNNISMAQALLQNSAASDSEPDLDTTATTDSPDTPEPAPVNPRVSAEVVKTLHFEDDDSATDQKDSTLATPVKKFDAVNATDLKDVSRLIGVPMNTGVEDRQCTDEPATCKNNVSVNLMLSQETEKVDNVNPIVLEDTTKYEPRSDTLKQTDFAHEQSMTNTNKTLPNDIECEDDKMQLDSETSKQALHESTHNVSATSSDCDMDVIYVEPSSTAASVAPSVDLTGDNMTSKHEKRKHITCSRSPLEETPKPASKIAKRSVSPVPEAESSDITNISKLPDEHVPTILIEESPPKKDESPEIVSSKPTQIEVKLQPIVDLQTELKLKSSPVVEQSELNSSLRETMDVDKQRDDDETEGKDEDMATQITNPPLTEIKAVSAFTPEPAPKEVPAPAPKAVSAPAPVPATKVVPVPTPVVVREEPDLRAAIDRLPCIVNGEVEWESRSGEEWSFLLLCARFRLTLRLVHSHGARARVQASTRVIDVTIEHAQPVEVTNKSYHGGALCLQYALDAIRALLSRPRGAVTVAGDLVTAPSACGPGAGPGALERCAALCRVATRWGRAMHVTRGHLAYELADNGRLTLTVANLPLQSVWKVSMNIVLDTDAKVPHPCARDVVVTPVEVCPGLRVTEHDVSRAVNGVLDDWGHAPNTLWKIFRYLKNRPLEDTLLGGLASHAHKR